MLWSRKHRTVTHPRSQRFLLHARRSLCQDRDKLQEQGIKLRWEGSNEACQAIKVPRRTCSNQCTGGPRREEKEEKRKSKNHTLLVRRRAPQPRRGHAQAGGKRPSKPTYRDAFASLMYCASTISRIFGGLVTRLMLQRTWMTTVSPTAWNAWSHSRTRMGVG